ncbi:sulfatase [Pelagicoccus mobilis]|uniref:Sulfatase n=1 Tax=Pelagicoccus mobilis TaxID=415221 RepID=A0A934S0Q4_9BACT|nr:sulfatase [Pelagicoccus mobilis]MBK1879060.1 sulfatase [Pelagicoccus mobilis]
MRLTSALRYLFCLFAFTASVGLDAKAPERPNVLFLISDDLNTALSGFGHAQCKTPNLDRLAARGVKFENMHCQYPVCGASRASMLTGLYPYSNGTLGNWGVERAEGKSLNTLPELFRENGYFSARVGKIYHMNVPSDIVKGSTWCDDEPSWDEVVNIKALEHEAPGVSVDWSPAFKGSQTFRSVETTTGDSENADGMSADGAIRYLENMGDRPFFLAVGFVRPHVPLVAPAKYFELYDREAMLPPVVPEDDLLDVPKVIRGYKDAEDWGVTPELHKGLMQAYYASISYMDAQVGRVLDALEENGYTENTIVVFTSDHGYQLGEHHKYQKQHLFEESTRVPFIVSVPWLKGEHGRGTLKITELVDLYPTIAELTGVAAPDWIQGDSLVGLLSDPDSRSWAKSDAFTISRSGGESLRTDRWRFTQWGWGKKGLELYDRQNDPGEFTNLAENPEYAATVKRLQARLVERREAAGYDPEIHNAKAIQAANKWQE